jgi:hypothetical protein
MVPSEIFIDAALWRGDTLEERLVTLPTWEPSRRSNGIWPASTTATPQRNSKALAASMIAAATDTGKRYFLFEARVKRIGLDMASRCLMRYQRLPCVENKKLAD